MPQPIGNILKIMLKVILDMFILVMMNHAIFGLGKIQIKLKNRNQWLLKEVRHVPNLRKNLISIERLESE